jgi:hypothetical protein
MIKAKFIIAILLVVFNVATFAAVYYVSPLGDDSNAGTSEANSFKRVQYAIDQMQAGDELIVLDGFYSGEFDLKSGITLKAKNPRKAIFSGVNSIRSVFEKHNDNIYKTRINKEIKQLFFNDQPMTWARWPNAKWSENREADKKWALAKDGTGPGVLTSMPLVMLKILT